MNKEFEITLLANILFKEYFTNFIDNYLKKLWKIYYTSNI